MSMKLKTLNKYILIILGFLILYIYMWIRFIRERLPRDIPINLSMFGFIILLEICCIYGYIVYSLLRKNHKTNLILMYLIDQIYKPLITFDNFIKSPRSIQRIYVKFMIYISYKLSFGIKETSIFYFIFAIFPRLVLITALVIDTFYFHRLYFLYKVLLIGIFLFLHSYIIYSLKHTKEFLIVNEEQYISSFSVKYVPGVVPEDDEDNDDVDEEDKDWIPPTMQLLPRKFIEYQTNAIVYENRRHSFTTWTTDKYWEEICLEYKLNPNDTIPRVIINKVCDEKDVDIKNIIQLSVILEYYNLSVNDERYKNIKKLIFTNYFICWIYILLISFHTLPKDTFYFIYNMIDFTQSYSQLVITVSLIILILLSTRIYKHIYRNKENEDNK